jgi:dethiobiotin synthetase
VFVTATDTGVGKTIVASAIAATLAARGEHVAVFKPAITGLAEVDAPLPDHELLLASARSSQSAGRGARG